MKKHLFILFLGIFSLFVFTDAKAQIKLHNDGHVSLGDLSYNFCSK